MTSQAQNTYTQPLPLPPPPPSLSVSSQQLQPPQLQQQPPSSQGATDPLSDSLVDGLPSYFTLNYAQQAALFLANAAAAAAASASATSVSAYTSPDVISSARANVAIQKTHTNHMTVGSSSNSQDSFLNNNRCGVVSPQSKHSSLQPPITPGKQNQRGLSTGKSTATTSAGATGTVGDKSNISGVQRTETATALLTNLFGVGDGRLKDPSQTFNSTPTLRHVDIPLLDTSSGGKSDGDGLRLTPTSLGTKRAPDTSNSIPLDTGSNCLNEAILANQLLQSLSGAQMSYQRQVQQQHQQQQQQQQQQQTALLLAGLAGFPTNYLDSLMVASGSSNRTGQPVGSVSAASPIPRNDQTSANNSTATNLAYAQAMMMAMAAACGGLKPSPGIPGALNYDMLPFGPFGSPGNNSSLPPAMGTPQPGMNMVNSPGEPAESFSDVLTFLSQCLNNSKNIPDRPMSNNSIATRPSSMEHKSFPSSPTMQRRPGRAGSTSRTRLPGNTQNSSWEPHAVPPPTRHRGRGRPPKSAVSLYQSQIKQQHQQNQNQNHQQLQQQQSHLLSGSKFQEDSEAFPMSVDSTIGPNYGGSRRPSSTTSTSDCSIDETIEEVLRHLAACDHDPAIVASRYASSSLGMALSRKRRKEFTFPPPPAPSTPVSCKSDSGPYRSEPGELYTHCASKRLRSGPSAESGLRLPLALGWRRETLVKGIGPGGILGEVIYVSPCGRRLWNLDSVREYLKTNNMNMLSVDDFSFKSYLRLGDYYECSRTSQVPQSYVKMSEAALNALTSAGLSEIGPESKATPSSSRWSSSAAYYDCPRVEKDIHSAVDLLASPSTTSHVSNTTTTPTSLVTMQPPLAHMHNSTTNLITPSITTTTTTAIGAVNVPTSDLVSFSVPGALYTNPADRSYSAYPSNCTVNGGDQQIAPPVAHTAAKDLSNKLSIPQTVTSLEPHGPYYPHPGLCPYIPSTPWSTNLNPSVAGADSQWATMNRSVGLISSPTFTLGTPGLSSLNPVVRIKEQFDQELKKPVNDLQLLNLRPLPELESIPDNRLSNKAFTDCLVVLEFLHAFTEILCIDSETIPTMGVLQAGLLDHEPTCQRAVLHLLIELLKFAILDPGLPSSRLVTQLLGQRFSELEVNEFTVTGLLRVFLIGRNGFEDDMSDWLRPPTHFTDLSADQQAALLAFVCDELVGSSRLISTEVDRTIELQAALKREKWILESKIRRLRFLMLRKFGVCGPNESGDNYPHLVQSQKFASPTATNVDHSESVAGNRSIDDPTAAHLVDDISHSPMGVIEDVETDSLRPAVETRISPETETMSARNGIGPAVSKSTTDSVTSNNDCTVASTSNHVGNGTPNSTKKTLTVTQLSGSAAPNASATATAAVSAAAMASAFLSGDEEEVEDVAQLEARIETLNQVVEYKQRAIEECSYRLSGLFLGQDRFYRRYYIFGHLGGIYIQGHAVKQKPSSSVSPDLSAPDERDEQNVDSVNAEDDSLREDNEEDHNQLSPRDSNKTQDGSIDFLNDYQLDDDDDARLGFDPDQIVALIRTHHELADSRRYKINLPSSSVHGSSSGHSQHHGQAFQSQITSPGLAQQYNTQKPTDSFTTVAMDLPSDSALSPKAANSLNPANSSAPVTSECSTEKPLPSCSKALLKNVDIVTHDVAASPVVTTETLDLQLEESHSKPISQSLQNPVRSCALVRFVSEMDGEDLREFSSLNSRLSPSVDITNEAELPTSMTAVGVEKFVDETIESSTGANAEGTNASDQKREGDSNEATELSSCQSSHLEVASKQLYQKSDEEEPLLTSELKPVVNGSSKIECDSKLLVGSNSVEKQEDSFVAARGTVMDSSRTELCWKCEDFVDTVHGDAINLKVETNTISAGSSHRADPTADGLVNSKKVTGVSVQPLDLSTKSVPDLPEVVLQLKSSSIPETPEASYAFITSLGLDDVALTTAALLFMTHTSIIPATVACSETLFEPWKSIIAHYKSILIWALMEELRTDGVSDPAAADVNGDVSRSGGFSTLRDAMLLLKKSFAGDSKPNSPSVNSDLLEGFSRPVSDSEVADLVCQELQSRRIQSKQSQTTAVQAVTGLQVGDKPKPVTGWYRLVSPVKLHELIHALASRGLRERNLAKALKRLGELVEPSLKVATDVVFEFDTPITDPAYGCMPPFLRVRSRRGKGRGGSGGNVTANSSCACLIAHSQSHSMGMPRSETQPCLNESASCGSLRHLDGVDCIGHSGCPSPNHFPWTTEDNNTGLSATGGGSSGSANANNSDGVTILESRLRRRPNHGTTRPDVSHPLSLQSANNRIEKRSVLSPGSRNGDPHSNGRTLAELLGNNDSSFLAECSFLEEVESLEDRVLSASLQVKGWQAPWKVLDDETIHLIPRTTPKRSRFEHWPLDLARNRLLGLESHLERRYLLPPLNSEVHLDVVPEPDVTAGCLLSSIVAGAGSGASTGENSRSAVCDNMTETETESESGTGGPGSEGTGSKEHGEAVHHPQIRRVVSKRPVLTAGSAESNLFGVGSIYSPLSSYGSDLQDASTYLFGTFSTENLPPGLVDWRHRLHRAMDIDTMRSCMDQLIQAIAWDKSIMKVLCQICRRDNNEAQLLLCDGCDHGYHTYCFRPPLVDIPAGDWFCYDCVSKATSKSHCFVCGGTQTNGPSACWSTAGVSSVSGNGNSGNGTTTTINPTAAATSTNSIGDTARLVTCEQCARAVHGCCARPPMTRIPRRWICPTCTVSTGRAKPKSALSTISTTATSEKQQNAPVKNNRPTDHDSEASLESHSTQHSKEAKRPRSDNSKSKTPSGNQPNVQTLNKSVLKSKSTTTLSGIAGSDPSTTGSSCSKSKTSAGSKLCPKSRSFGAGLFLSKMKKNKKKKQRKIKEQSCSKTQQQSLIHEHQRNPLKKFKLGTKLSVTCGTASKKHTAKLADLAYAYPGNDSNESKGGSRSIFPELPGPGMPSSSSTGDSAVLPRSQSEGMFPDDVLLDSNSSSRDSSQMNEIGTGKDGALESKECMSSQELIWCRMATEDLINHEASWAFRKPVNVKQVPFYRKVIKHPMDLSTIQRKARDAGSYSSFNEWLSDVRLIFNNCEIFNEDDSDVGRAGHTMRAYFEAHWARMPEPLPGTAGKSHESPEQRELISSASIRTALSPTVSSDSETETPSTEANFNLPPTNQKSSLTAEIELADRSQLLAGSHLASSPVRSVESADSRSSGFSGFDQNEYMIGLQLDDELGPPVTQSDGDQVDTAIHHRARSTPPTVASEVCDPTTNNAPLFK
ncbi:Bromodomain adjacent to zinc finger domain protein 2B [Fasciola hepatica]|uniref:Bromodomain adjacent to zinc finger domain protein 2B n=1 Tax=Fasciola hepatica TaxID=6192 RepID=A0A4E0R7E8_FASHE|nr:Bromodomain adjacent to zinc finger domain protein 2B [Fasciola hepatica]